MNLTEQERNDLRSYILPELAHVQMKTEVNAVGPDILHGCADRLISAVERIFAQRTPVAEDAVEAVADAIGNSMGASIAPDGFKVYVDWDVLVEAARAALEAAAPVSDLDAMLDSVHPRARVNWMSPQAGGEWAVGLVWWDFPTHDHIDPEMPLTQRPIVGTGPTRTAAIADALAKVRKEATQ